MERLIMLGTGNALVTRCYNTCFAIQDDDEYFLVDAGGGNGIMRASALPCFKAGIASEPLLYLDTVGPEPSVS